MKTIYSLNNYNFLNNCLNLEKTKTIRKFHFILININSKNFFSKNHISSLNKRILNHTQSRNFCFWKRIDIPFDQIDMSYCRSSGPGGQNVNKLNSKVEYRFNIQNADWLSNETKERLKELYSNKINNEGFFILTCQEYRTQSQNKKEAQKKLQEIIDIASMPKKERVIIPYEESPEMEEKRIKGKKMRSDVKKMRNNHHDF